MSLLEQQKFLAKLYTVEKFRENFIAKPYKFGRENKLNVSEITELIEILPDEIAAFADSLFYKRLREVERFLSLTRKVVLDKDFERPFREFAKEFNPKSAKKHLEDAIEFAKFLQKKNLDFVWIGDIAKLEQAKLEFGGLDKRFVVRQFDYDVSNFQGIDTAMWKGLERRFTVGIWFKVGRFRRHFVL